MKKYFNFYIWFYLFLNILVILGGALVRATNSGAGCGDYWPLCRGKIMPDLTVLNTLIEFTHRVSSGVVGVGAVLLVVGAFFYYPKTHIVRRGSLSILFFVFLEAILGAALVLFRLVENDTSAARIWMMALHLTNTFLLLASITLTASWASNFSKSFSLFCFKQYQKQQVIFSKRKYMITWICLLCLLITGVTGALTALSDTIFKPTHIAQNLYEDFFTPKHILHMLRLFHPAVALITSGVLGYTVATQTKFIFSMQNSDHNSRLNSWLAILILSFILIQITVGMSNMLFFTPIVLQLIHLFIADILWILSVLYFNNKLYLSSLSRTGSVF